MIKPYVSIALAKTKTSRKTYLVNKQELIGP